MSDFAQFLHIGREAPGGQLTRFWIPTPVSCVSLLRISMLSPELIELIVRHGWDCLSTTNYRHAYAMTQWMLVSRNWLRIVVLIVSRDVWITSPPHLQYICAINKGPPSYIYRLAGMDSRSYVMDNCRFLTITAYQERQEEYVGQCAELEEYARNSECTLLIKDLLPVNERKPSLPIHPRYVASLVRDYTPNITSLHFILVDFTPAYHHWEMPPVTRFIRENQFPKTLTDLCVTFAYTTPPPTLLRDAPRGTFFPLAHQEMYPHSTTSPESSGSS